MLGKLDDDRYRRMALSYEKEQKELLASVAENEQAIKDAEKETVDLRVFLEMIRKCTELTELTPAIVNTLVKRIDVHNSRKDGNGVKHVPIDIRFTAVGILNIPTQEELIRLYEEMKQNPIKTA